jgi:hypothetical protein
MNRPREGLPSRFDAATGRMWSPPLGRPNPMGQLIREVTPRSEMLSMTVRTPQFGCGTGPLVRRRQENLSSRFDAATTRARPSTLNHTNSRNELNREPRSEMISMAGRTQQDHRGATSSSRRPMSNGTMLTTQHDREMASR